MCLLIDTPHHKNLEPLIADQDIPVYKIIGYDDRSVWYDFIYTPNKTYVLPNSLRVYTNKKNSMVEAGFHSYANINTALRFLTNDDKLVNFVIPKGAKYFIGREGDIVSDKIRSGGLRPMVDKSK